MQQQTVRVKLNPALLIWARETAGLEIPNIAHTLGITIERLISWEHGEGYPTINQLEAFAKQVHRPLAALFLPTPPREPRLPRDFRRLPGSELSKFSPKVLLAFREARNTLKNTEALFNEIEFNPPFLLPGVSLRDDTARIAQLVRKTLGVTIKDQMKWNDEYTALRNWRDLILDYGVLSLQFSFPNDEVRGFSMRGQSLNAIAVSSKDYPVARIFSLFHEFYHLCLGKPGVSGPDIDDSSRLMRPRVIVEQVCNAFAADFLVPLDDESVRSALITTAKTLQQTDQPIKTLAAKLKVSKYVILRRLLTIDLISQSDYSNIIEKWNAVDKSRKSTGFSLPDTKSINKGGPRLSRLVVEALDTGHISERDACSLLSVNPKWLGEVRSKLASGGPND